MTTKEWKKTRLPFTEKELAEKFRQADADDRFFQASEEDLLAKYAEQWIAIHKGALVAHDQNIEAVRKELKQKRILPGEAMIKFLTKKPKNWML